MKQSSKDTDEMEDNEDLFADIGYTLYTVLEYMYLLKKLLFQIYILYIYIYIYIYHLLII